MIVGDFTINIIRANVDTIRTIAQIFSAINVRANQVALHQIVHGVGLEGGPDEVSGSHLGSKGCHLFFYRALEVT
jgi:hypothetical protein